MNKHLSFNLKISNRNRRNFWDSHSFNKYLSLSFYYSFLYFILSFLCHFRINFLFIFSHIWLFYSISLFPFYVICSVRIPLECLISVFFLLCFIFSFIHVYSTPLCQYFFCFVLQIVFSLFSNFFVRLFFHTILEYTAIAHISSLASVTTASVFLKHEEINMANPHYLLSFLQIERWE